MLVLALLLATLQAVASGGARTCGLAKKGELKWPFKSDGDVVKIQWSNWASSRVVANLVAIVLREKLGYSAELMQSQSGKTYRGLASEDGNDIDMELWPELPVKAKEKKEAKSAQCGALTPRPCVSPIFDPLGFTARSGWFLPTATLPSSVSGAFSVNTTVKNATFELGIYQVLDMAASPLISGTLMKADELPSVNVCADRKVATGIAASHGTYDCTDGTWTPNNVQCCPRGQSCNLPGALPRCLALTVEFPSYDVGFNEWMLVQSGLPYQIVYGGSGGTEKQVTKAIAQGRLLLFYWWEPDNFMTTNPFVRVSSQPWEYCAQDSSGNMVVNPNNATTSSLRVGAMACDFPFQRVEKSITTKRDASAAVSQLVGNVVIRFSDMMDMLKRRHNHGNDDAADFAAACEWLLANEESIVNKWVEGHPQSTFTWAMWLALAFFCVVAVNQAIAPTQLLIMWLHRLREKRMKKQNAMAMQSDHEWQVRMRAADDLQANTDFDERAPWVTLGNSQLAVLESDPHIDVQIIRLGDAAEPLEVELETHDVTARLGKEYRGLVGPAGGSKPSRSIKVRIEPEQRLCTATIPLKQVPYYTSVKSFKIWLKPPPDVRGGRLDCHVRIYNVEPFPNGKLFKDDDLLGKGASTFKTCWCRISIVYHFLISAHKESVGASVWHQIGRVYSAAFKGFMAPLLYTMMIKHGTQEHHRYDYSVYTGLMMASLYLLDLTTSQWFHAGWDVQKQLQRNLSRKFLSHSERDHAAMDAKTKEVYRVTINETCEKLTEEAYGKFHSFLSNLWSLIFAITYIFYTSSEMSDIVLIGYGIMLTVALVVLPIIHCVRANTTWRLWKEKYSADVRVADMLGTVLNQFSLIRANKREGRETIKLEESISSSLNAGFRLWYYNLVTDWWCDGSLQFVKYGLWAAAPLLTSRIDQLMTAADFLVVLYLIDFAGSAAHGLQESLISMYVSGSMVQEVARLLNSSSTEEMRLQKDAHLLDAPADGDWHQADGDCHPAAKEETAEPKPEVKVVDEVAADKSEKMKEALENMIAQELGEPHRMSSLEFHVQELSSLTCMQKTLIEDSRFIVSGHLGLLKGAKDAMRIYKACYHQLGQPSIFKDLVVYNANEELIKLIPAGGMIGVRTSAKNLFGELCETALMKLLSGDFHAQSGTAAVFEEAQLVTSHPTVLRGTLMQNLLYGVVPDSAFDGRGLLKDPLPEDIHMPTSEQNMWRLCKRAGISRILIGDTFEQGKWASQRVSQVLPSLQLTDVVHVGLVRALLHKPKVLLLLLAGCDLEEQAKLHDILESYLTCNGDIGQMLDEIEAGNPNKLAQPTSHNTIVVCNADPLLAAYLDLQRDMVLTIETPSRATLKKAADAFDKAKVRQIMEMRRSGLLKASWD